MAARYFLRACIAIGMVVMAVACSVQGTNGTDRQAAETTDQHSNAAVPKRSLLDVIKNGKLVNHQSSTIGAAFDSYRHLTGKEWRLEQLKSGHFTIDYIGWFKPGILSGFGLKNGMEGKGLEVKFVVEPNGSFYLFMISVIETGADGKMPRIQYHDIAAILDRIYANEKIVL